jgi:hypothetical protein
LWPVRSSGVSWHVRLAQLPVCGRGRGFSSVTVGWCAAGRLAVRPFGVSAPVVRGGVRGRRVGRATVCGSAV